ncbi:hypothetical protein UCRNP2_2458 [Neofusicoccum parvum UCRNP2]|uniref:DUF6594 domain-containing protein n=1 Tax=Botryosphaeria parva (strain UCR-NP2) TaxID=1287680 RepID=R1GRB6_BOTPV|nr:hypothetical protein UCRNP2_2458 [Neofusicoccum parvum UCRNP2]
MSAAHEDSSTSNMKSVASEKVETPEPAGADERQDSPQTEENDAPWRRSNYTSLYRSGDSVYWCPDGRRRKQEGPYKVIAAPANGASELSVWHIQDSWIRRLPRRLTNLTIGSKEKEDVELNPQCIDYHPSGYPKLAAWLNSDENFLMCRRYGFLHSRVLLYRQDELRALEEDLLELDLEDKEADPRVHMSRVLDDSRNDERKKLIRKIDEKLKEYEEKFMDYDQDFVALVDPKEGGWFDAVLEDWFIPYVPRRISKIMFSDEAQRKSTADKHVNLYSKDRIDTFARILITIIAVALLMAPVVVLFNDEESGTVKIVVILAFTLGFSAALSVFTKAKRHEVFAATAA